MFPIISNNKWGEIIKLPKDVMDLEIHRVLETSLTEKSPNLRAQCISIGTKVHGKRIFPECQML